MTFAGMAKADEDDCVRVIQRAFDAGITLIGTADRQSRRAPEEIVGRALEGRRDRVVLTTEVHGPMGDAPSQQGHSRRWTTRAVEGSLRRLRTDHIDPCQVRRPAPDTDVEETLSALTDLMRAGEVRAIGFSTFPASGVVEAQWAVERRGRGRLRTEQPPCSIHTHPRERGDPP